MDNYSFLADLLNKFHTSLPWIQFFWIVAVPTCLFSLVWCIKEICIAFAKPAKLKGELVYSVYRNDEGELFFYYYNPTQERIERDNIVILPVEKKQQQIGEKSDTAMQ